MFQPILSVISVSCIGFFTIAPVLDNNYFPKLEPQNKLDELYSQSQPNGEIFQSYAKSTEDVENVKRRGDGRR
ncbi:MAG: hypothetical protein SWJ54_18100 [Cyanobacteriota bacterium]|nr:hypothetical protein [Cyanobacteriota bacterium]